MIDWDTFMPEVLPELPGINYEMALNALRNSAIEFAERSQILRKTLADADVVADQQDYSVAASVDAADTLRTVVLVQVYIDGISAKALTETQKYQSTGTAEREFPWRYSMDGPETLHLEWIPDALITAGLSVRIAYKPLPTATECDDILYYDWYEYIAAGAKARMQGMAEEKWSNSNRARTNQSRYILGINNAWGRVNKSHTGANSRVAFTPMSGGHRRGDISL